MERSAFEQLCEDHYTRVVRVAFLIAGDRQEALDIAQETFTRAVERWGQVSKMENQAGWLYRVATNLAISGRRRLRRLDGVVDHAAETSTAEPSDPALVVALQRLTPAQRAIVVLRFYLDWSVDATAEALRKRPGTVRAQSSQAIARLRETLGESWLEVRDD